MSGAFWDFASGVAHHISDSGDFLKWRGSAHRRIG